jgi:nitroreductase
LKIRRKTVRKTVKILKKHGKIIVNHGKIRIFVCTKNKQINHKMKKIILAMAMMLSLGTMESMAQNAALDNIMTRTSVRDYTDQPVEQAKVEQLLRAGMAAPTAVNKQPWHFVVLNTREALDRMASANPRAGMLKRAPLAIVVCGDLQKTLDGKGQEYWIQDCSAATENILLAANALGLGAVWTALHPMEDRTKAAVEALGLPSHIVPLCTIVIGYPKGQTQPKDKWKPENVSYNKFGDKQ